MFDDEQLASHPITRVQIDSSALLQIMKHCRDHTVVGNGQLLGMELGGVLQITHTFPVATKTAEEDVNETEDSEYQLNMMRNLRQLNYDANAVGWYQSTYLGSHWNQVLIETQYEYQKALEHAIVILYDPTQTALGSVSLKAMRLTDKFMDLFANRRFSMDVLVQHKLSPSMIFETLPIQVKNSQLANALLYQLEDFSLSSLDDMKHRMDTPAWSFEPRLEKELAAIHPYFDILEQRSTQFLEKHLEYLGETIDEYGQEQWRWHGWQRNLAKEQQKIHFITSKRRQENEQRVADGKDALYTEEDLQATSTHLQRLISHEPSRLESLVIASQVETYCDQVKEFSAAFMCKMHAIKALQEASRTT